MGGILPPIAMDFHRENIERIVQESLESANVSVDDLDAIAVTNRPGLKMSIKVGLRYAKHLARKHDKPIIPIHHMEAHALTARLENEIEFPFLCLLVSGGHCLLAYVEDVDKFKLLGESVDDAPGEALDKIARELKLRNLPKFEGKSGGQQIEEAAEECRQITDKYRFPLLMARTRDCQFSFAGLKNVAKRYIRFENLQHSLDVDQVLPDYPDFSANFLGSITRHICNRTQRAIEFCENEGMFDGVVKNKTLVISGGVASNNFIFETMSQMCEMIDFKAVRPSRRLCTDNGVMIAWNGVERFQRGLDIVTVDDFEEIEPIPKCRLGVSYIEKVKNAQLQCKWLKVANLMPFSRPGK